MIENLYNINKNDILFVFIQQFPEFYIHLQVICYLMKKKIICIHLTANHLQNNFIHWQKSKQYETLNCVND